MKQTKDLSEQVFCKECTHVAKMLCEECKSRTQKHEKYLKYAVSLLGGSVLGHIIGVFFEL